MHFRIRYCICCTPRIWSWAGLFCAPSPRGRWLGVGVKNILESPRILAPGSFMLLFLWPWFARTFGKFTVPIGSWDPVIFSAPPITWLLITIFKHPRIGSWAIGHGGRCRGRSEGSLSGGRQAITEDPVGRWYSLQFAPVRPKVTVPSPFEHYKKYMSFGVASEKKNQITIQRCRGENCTTRQRQAKRFQCATLGSIIFFYKHVGKYIKSCEFWEKIVANMLKENS